MGSSSMANIIVNSFVNNGFIEGLGAESYGVSINGTANSFINNGGATIVGNFTGLRVDREENLDFAITNSGTIKSLNHIALVTTAQNPSSIPITVAATLTNTATGLIEGKSAGLLFFHFGSPEIHNHGTIRSISGWGIQISSPETTTIYNYDGGLIEGGTVGISGNSGNEILINQGSIIGQIDFGAGNDNVTNSGTITGDIDLGDGSDVFENIGTITGDVSLGDGDDSFNLKKIGEITGSVDAGLGTDTLLLSSDVTYNGSFVGFERLTVLGDTVTLTGTQTYSAGVTLAFSAGLTNDGTLTADITGDDNTNILINNGTITGNIDLRGGDDIYAINGTVSTVVDGGAGTDTVQFETVIPDPTLYTNFEILEKTGGGAFDLTADAVLGSLSAGEGDLAINANITADITVQAIGTLMGSGTIIGDVVNGGSLAPGNSVGTLNITGAYTQSATGSYDLEIEGTNGDQLNITGTATLDGTLNVSLTLSDTDMPDTQGITFINTTGGVTGKFATVNASVTQFFRVSLAYSDKTVQLILQRSNFLQPFMTTQQAAIARTLDLISPSSVGVTPSFIKALRFTERTAAGAVLDQLPSLAAANLATPVYAARHAFIGSMVDEAQNFASGNYETGKWTSFATGFGQFGDVEGSTTSSGLSYSMGGAVMTSIYGINENTRVGFAVGGAGSSMDITSQVDSNKHKSVQTAAFAHWSQNNFSLMGAVGASFESFDLERAVVLGSFSEKANTDVTGYSVSAHVEGRYDINIGKLKLSPTASVQISRFERGEYAETGLDNLGLTVASQGLSSTRASLGMATNYSFTTSNGNKIIPHFSAYWDQELGEKQRIIDAAFIADPTTRFAITGQLTDRHSGRFEGGVGMYFNNNFGASLGYKGTIGSHATSHQVSARLRWTW